MKDVLEHRDAFAAGAVRIMGGLIVAGGDARDIIHDIFPDLGASGPDESHGLQISLTREMRARASKRR